MWPKMGEDGRFIFDGVSLANNSIFHFHESARSNFKL